MASVAHVVRCEACGAPQRRLPDALAVFCDRCGAFVEIESGRVFSGDELARAHDDAVRGFLRPSRAQARVMSLAATLEEAREAGDRDAFHAAALEQIALTAATTRYGKTPSLTPAEWTRRSVRMMELGAFDDVVRERQRAYGEACGALVRASDKIAAAREMLDRARAWYGAMDERAPEVFRGESTAAYAKSAVRTAVTAYQGMLGPGVAQRLFVEVLGDSPGVERCPVCGAPIDGGASACAYCGARLSLQRDAWLEGVLAQWSATRAELARTGALDDSTPILGALQLVLVPATLSGASVDADAAWAFLVEAVPWKRADEIQAAIDLLLHGAAASVEATLRTLRERAAAFPTRPELRPAKPSAAAPVDETAPTEEDQDAFVEYALALVRLSPTKPNDLQLVGYALSPLQVASARGERAAVTPAAAMRFFERARPSFDREAMRAAVASLRRAYTQPPVAPFLSGLEELLRGG